MNIGLSQIEFSLPQKRISNDTLSSENPDWDFTKIFPKTGITNRFITEENESCIDLAIKALNKINPSSLSIADALIFVTQTPPRTIPHCSCIIQKKLGIRNNIMAFDLGLGCSGFVYGLFLAATLLQTEKINNVLLVCAETYSKFIENDDRSSRSIFSDAASATVINKSDKFTILDFEFITDGSGSEFIRLDENLEGGMNFVMQGSEVFLYTIREVPDLVKKIIFRNNLSVSDINHFVFHQASKLVIDSIASALNLDDRKLYRNYQNIGNTGSSSIPIILKEIMNDDKIKKGDFLLICGFGVGMSCGSILFKVNY